MADLTAHELCQRLAIDAKQLNSWTREGLPHTGRGRSRRFSPPLVRQWLLEHGKAEAPPAPDPPAAPQPAGHPPEQPIAHTRAQVASWFGVSERTVATWALEGMPGRMGRPGTKEGQFPLTEIAAWLDGRRADGRPAAIDETKHQAQARLASARAALIELELREKQGQLVALDDVDRRWLRLQTEAKAQLEQLPALLGKLLPEGTAADLRKKTRQRAERAIANVLDTLAQFTADEAHHAATDPPTP